MKNREKLYGLVDKLVDLKAQERVAYVDAVREPDNARRWNRRNRLCNAIHETEIRLKKAIEKESNR